MRWGTRLSRITVTLALSLNAPFSEAQGANGRWKTLLEKPDAWYKSTEGARIAANIVSFQSDEGSWPKNIDTTTQAYTGDRRRLQGTFDNGATFGELRFLAKSYQAAGRECDRTAFLKGFDHVLRAQYPTGGWPQLYPPGEGYHRHITFNDGAMVNVLEFLHDVVRSSVFSFIDEPRRTAAQRAFDSGLKCILKCQIKVSGVLTIWCDQHDEHTLEPRWGRSFEPPALTSAESAGILQLLMTEENPSPEIRLAVRSAAKWFEAAAIQGIRQINRNGEKEIVADSGAPALWARFYEIGSNRPIFCGRDGVIQYELSRIEAERRNGYAWYGSWGQDVATRYARWKKEWEPDRGDGP